MSDLDDLADAVAGKQKKPVSNLTPPPGIAVPGPMNPPPIYYPPPPFGYWPQPVVTEKTSKVWKAQMLGGIALIGFGLLLMMGSCVGGNGYSLGVSVLLTLGGFVWFLVGVLGGWWNHG